MIEVAAAAAEEAGSKKYEGIGSPLRRPLNMWEYRCNLAKWKCKRTPFRGKVPIRSW